MFFRTQYVSIFSIQAPLVPRVLVPHHSSLQLKNHFAAHTTHFVGPSHLYPSYTTLLLQVLPLRSSPPTPPFDARCPDRRHPPARRRVSHRPRPGCAWVQSHLTTKTNRGGSGPEVVRLSQARVTPGYGSDSFRSLANLSWHFEGPERSTIQLGTPG